MSVWLHQCLQTQLLFILTNILTNFQSQGTKEVKQSCLQAPAWLRKIVTHSQLDRLWPIYMKATLPLIGPPLLFFLSPLFYYPTFPVLIHLLFINVFFWVFCSVVVFLTSISIYNIPDTLPVVFFLVLCKCVMIKIAFHNLNSVCKKCYLLRCDAGHRHWLHS